MCFLLMTFTLIWYVMLLIGASQLFIQVLLGIHTKIWKIFDMNLNGLVEIGLYHLDSEELIWKDFTPCRFSKMDPSLSGRGADTVYRDKQGMSFIVVTLFPSFNFFCPSNNVRAVEISMRDCSWYLIFGMHAIVL